MAKDPDLVYRKLHYMHWTPGTVQLASCISCVHRLEQTTCEAFPEGIPEEILMGDNPHISEFPGDNGIQYEPAAVTKEE